MNASSQLKQLNPESIATLLDLARQARHAESIAELDFMAVNATHALMPYRQAALWFANRKVCMLSGVVQIEANAPYMQWLERLCQELHEAGPVDAQTAPASVANEWEDWLPACGVWIPLISRGGLLLAREIPWQKDEIALLTEWADILQHAYDAKLPGRSFHSWRHGAFSWRNWRKRRTTISAALITMLILFFPVRLSVLAQGELVPAHPAVIRAPLDGVIERFHVQPNEHVKKDQRLFHYDEAQLASHYAVAKQALTTAEAEYRQALQQTLADGKSKNLLASLQGKIEERRAETEFLSDQVARAHVVAPREGIALFDDPSEWVGRPVVVGERIMRIATPNDVEVEAWLAVGDAIPLEAGADVHLYLSASPLSPVAAHIRYVGYEAQQRPDGSYAYRVRATLSESTAHRVGLKGTAKLMGSRVPLIYWILRRPIGAIRQVLGW